MLVHHEEHGHRGARIVAKSIFRELKTNGYTFGDVIVVAATLVGLITEDARMHRGKGAAGDIAR
jgi:hypothetical protein